MYLELLYTIHALQRTETLQRHLRCAGNELQEFSTIRLIETAQRTPEPLNLWSRCSALDMIIYDVQGETLPVPI